MIGLYGFHLKELKKQGKLTEKWDQVYNEVFVPSGNTPLNTPLIPEMTSNTEPMGTCGATRNELGTNTRNSSNDLAESTINGMAWRFFNPAKHTVKSESKVYAPIAFWYTLDSSQYSNGFFDPGTYKFETVFGSGNSNLLAQGDVYIQNANDEWIQVLHIIKVNPDNTGTDYPNVPHTMSREFTTDIKFKAIKFVKINTPNYDHSRTYYRYGTQLTKLA